MSADGATLRVLRCRSGGVEWALPEESLREVAPVSPAARVPGTAAAVLGMVNLRGSLLMAIDSRALLGEPTGTEPGALVVVDAGGRKVALAVDLVDDLEVVPIDRLEPVPLGLPVPPGAAIALVRAPRPMLILDADALVRPLFGAAPATT